MKIETFLAQLLEHCGIDLESTEVVVDEQDDIVSVQVDLPEEESGIMIGFHGEVLESIQRILRVVFFEQYQDKKIVLNINDYRERRKEKLEELTINSAHRVLETGRSFTFRSFLPSYERFLVHSTLSNDSEFAELESISHGDGKMRRLTIQLKQAE